MAFYQFPGTDFHDLNLDWLLQQMKNCLAEWATTKTQWESVAAEWEDLKQFVTDYFENLDVSQEISDKINAMAADGSLLAVIQDTVALSAADEAGDWLTEHITAISGYVIDNTLMTTNAAADAKVAGDGIRRNTMTFNDELKIVLSATMKVRGFSPSTGQYTTNAKRSHSDMFVLETYHLIEAAPGYSFGTYVIVDGSVDTDQGSGWVKRLTLLPGVQYILGCRRDDDANMNDWEAVRAIINRVGGEVKTAAEGATLAQFIVPGRYQIKYGASEVFTDMPSGFVGYNSQLDVFHIVAGDYPNNLYVCQTMTKDTANYTVKRWLRLVGETYETYVDWFFVNSACALSGKTFSIMGDSISTYSGKIPTGYASYYPHSGNNVNSWTETYWGMLVQDAGMKLVVNDSWSGSYVSYNGSNTESYMAGPARIDALGSTAPDYMLILAGGNDCNNLVPIGEVTPDPVNLASVTAADASTYAQAYKIMLTRIKTKFPNTRLIILWYHNLSTSPNAAHGGTNYGTQAEYAAVARYYADLFGAQFIDLRKCGIDQFNSSGLETTNHPNEDGMKLYYNYITQMVVR